MGGYALALSGLAYFLYLSRAVLVPFVLAAAIAYVLEPPVRELERRGLPRGLAILAVYLGVSALMALAVWFFLPLLVEELNRLAEAIPEYTVRVRDFVRHMQTDYSRMPMPENVRRVLDEAIAGTEARLLNSIGDAITGLFALFASLLRVLIAPVLAFYMLRDLDDFRRRIKGFLPPATSRQWLALLHEVDGVVGGFIRGQVLVAVVVGILTGAALYLLRIRFATLLAIVAALGEFIPYFGPIVAAIPAVFVGFLTSPLKALQVLVAVTLIQQLDATVVGPKILGDRTGLHPLLVIFAVLTGGYLFGPWGLLLAVPVGAVIRVLLKHGLLRLRP